MKDRIFIDTNILIYSLDQYDAEKQKQARELLRLAAHHQQVVISTQVLQEFYVAATKKMAVDPLIAKQLVNGFAHFETMQITVDLIKEAVDCSITFQLSFWDALIVVTADDANCSLVWTEDMNDRQQMRGVMIRNPFRHFDEIRTQLLNSGK